MENDVNQFRPLIRAGGILYLILIMCGIYAEIFVVSHMIVGNNATATAKNIMLNESFYRSGAIAHIVTVVCGLALMGILFRIFKSTSEHLTMTMVIFNTAALALEGVSILYEFETVSILKSKTLAGLFSADQINALAYEPLKMQTTSYDLGLLLFGVVCCLISILIIKSELIQRWIGVLMFVAGVCYITNSVASYISPAFRSSLLPFILIPCLIAELALTISMIAGGRESKKHS